MSRRKKNQKLVKAAYASRDAKLPKGRRVAKAKHGWDLTRTFAASSSKITFESLLPFLCNPEHEIPPSPGAGRGDQRMVVPCPARHRASTVGFAITSASSVAATEFPDSPCFLKAAIRSTGSSAPAPKSFADSTSASASARPSTSGSAGRGRNAPPHSAHRGLAA